MNTRGSALFRDASGDRVERVLSPPGQHHARPFAGERKRSGLADSASRSGERRNLALESLHKSPP
jgi:hypothetical protein